MADEGGEKRRAQLGVYGMVDKGDTPATTVCGLCGVPFLLVFSAGPASPTNTQFMLKFILGPHLNGLFLLLITPEYLHGPLCVCV